MTIARFGMNFLTKLIVPRTERSSLIVVGVIKSTVIAIIRFSPVIRIPSNNFLRPKRYFGRIRCTAPTLKNTPLNRPCVPTGQSVFQS